MSAFLLTNIILLLIIAGLFIVLSAVWPPDSPWAPWWQMPEEVIRAMCKLTKMSSKDVMYELGCGTGRALIIAAKEHSAKAVGIEIDPVRFLFAKWNVFRFGQKGKITILKKNFFDVNIAPATIIFVYLVPKALGKLVSKFQKELKPGVLIASYIYEFPEKEAKGKLTLVKHDKQQKIFLYKLLS